MVLHVRMQLMSAPMFGSCILPFKSAPVGLPKKLFVFSFDKLVDVVLWFTWFLSRCSVCSSLESVTLLVQGHIKLETSNVNSLQFSATICLASLSFCSSFPGFSSSCLFFAFRLHSAKDLLSVGAVTVFFFLFFLELPFFPRNVAMRLPTYCSTTNPLWCWRVRSSISCSRNLET